MRGLKKPWPPGDVSPDGQEARTWQQAEEAFLQGLPRAANRNAYARATYGSLEKRKLRTVLYQEQGSLCVYCERRVKEGQPTPRIDHWRPLSAEPHLALHWRNLYLSCASEKTCDCRKSEARCAPVPLMPTCLGPLSTPTSAVLALPAWARHTCVTTLHSTMRNAGRSTSRWVSRMMKR
ncbi:MAG: TIGR02646 family protein [Ardenticatenia bacterium]|nr:TIGR02646 family protein [Ardenticatenia bacterium]